MKFDRKSRVLLLYVLLPLYLLYMGVFVYVSNVFMGTYELPAAMLDEGFTEFALKKYELAQEVSVSGPQGQRKVPPGTVVEGELAEGLVKAYGVVGKKIAVVGPGGRFEPRTIGAARAGEHGGPGTFLVYPVNIGSPPEGIQLTAGTELLDGTAARIERAAAAAPGAPDITIAAAVGTRVPENIESGEFREFVAAEYVLDEPVRVEVAGEEAIKEEGTIVSRDLLLALMRMRDEKAGRSAVRVRGKGPVIGFQWTFVFIVFNFMILVTFLHGLLWKPVLNILDKRKEAVRGDLSHARDRREKAEALFERYRRTLEGARAEREGIIEDGRREGEKEAQRILTEAKAESQAVLERARLAIEAERGELKRELTGQVAGLSADLAEKILRREIRREDHSALVDEFISGVGASQDQED